MSQKIYTRQIRMPRPRHRAVTAEDIKSAAQQDLQPGEVLIRVAFVAVDGDDLIIEAGFKREEALESSQKTQQKTQEASPSNPASPRFIPGQIRPLPVRPIPRKPHP